MSYSYKKDDFDDSKGGDFPLVSIGEHYVTCEEAEETISKASGNPMMELVFKVLDGVGTGGLLWYYVVFNEYAATNFGRMMESCGMDRNLDRVITPELFINKTFKIMVKHEHSESYGDQAKIHYFIAKKVEDTPDLDNPQKYEDDITGSETEPVEDTPY